MNHRRLVNAILAYQNKPHIFPGSPIQPVTIVLQNGNIELKQFRILELEENILVGVTRQEEYVAHRENREPVYCRFDFDEIKSIEWMNE